MVAYPSPGSSSARIWLPWHSWQLAKRSTVPRGRRGGQSPQSASDICGVMGSHPALSLDPVLQNQVSAVPDQSQGRKRSVPSTWRLTKPWVPPPIMWALPMTPSTLRTSWEKPTCRTTNS